MSVVTAQPGWFYFAHPYSADDKERTKANLYACCKRAAKLMADGWRIFSPISHSHPINEVWPGKEPENQYWYDLDEEMIRAKWFAGLILAPYWQNSNGCCKELLLFQMLDLPIYFLHSDGKVYTTPQEITPIPVEAP